MDTPAHALERTNNSIFRAVTIAREALNHNSTSLASDVATAILAAGILQTAFGRDGAAEALRDALCAPLDGQV